MEPIGEKQCSCPFNSFGTYFRLILCYYDDMFSAYCLNGLLSSTHHHICHSSINNQLLRNMYNASQQAPLPCMTTPSLPPHFLNASSSSSTSSPAPVVTTSMSSEGWALNGAAGTDNGGTSGCELSEVFSSEGLPK